MKYKIFQKGRDVEFVEENTDFPHEDYYIYVPFDTILDIAKRIVTTNKICERCASLADFNVRLVGSGVTFYLCKSCINKPDINEWIKCNIKEKLK